MQHAFHLAAKRKKHVTSATKSNGITYSMPDLGGKHSTKEVTDEIIKRLKEVDKKG